MRRAACVAVAMLVAGCGGASVQRRDATSAQTAAPEQDTLALERALVARMRDGDPARPEHVRRLAQGLLARADARCRHAVELDPRTADVPLRVPPQYDAEAEESDAPPPEPERGFVSPHEGIARDVLRADARYALDRCDADRIEAAELYRSLVARGDLTHAPDGPADLAALASTLELVGGDASRVWLTLARAFPDDPHAGDAYLYFARTRGDHGDLEDAMRLLDRAVPQLDDGGRAVAATLCERLAAAAVEASPLRCALYERAYALREGSDRMALAARMVDAGCTPP